MSESEGYPTEKPQERPLTREEMIRVLEERDAARSHMESLESLGREHFEHYDKVKKNQKFVTYLHNNLAAVWNDAIPIDGTALDWSDQQLAKNYTAVKEAYHQFLASNPKVVEAAKEAGKKEAKERAEAALSASSATGGGTSTEGKEESTEKSEAELMIERMVNARGRGISFSTVARKK